MFLHEWKKIFLDIFSFSLEAVLSATDRCFIFLSAARYWGLLVGIYLEGWRNSGL